MIEVRLKNEDINILLVNRGLELTILQGPDGVRIVSSGQGEDMIYKLEVVTLDDLTTTEINRV